jgi:predicted kinase
MWGIDWASIEEAFPILSWMEECPQEPDFHQEGDVLRHTKMVCESLVSLEEWRQLEERNRSTLFLAALLHDVGKLECTREEGGRITSRGHSRRGEIASRSILWKKGVPFRIREQVCALVAAHQIPFFLLERPDAKRLVIGLSQVLRNRRLALLSEADARGRICRDQQDLLDRVELFREFCLDLRCLEEPWKFASAHSRFIYFRNSQQSPEYEAYDDTRGEVIIMSGLPGAGKDHWIRNHRPDLPVVSLDAIREELKVKPTDKQGRVLFAAREQAREHLRKNRPFVWNATNLSRQIREQCVNLVADYSAKIRIVYVEVPEEILMEQNRRRKGAVPDEVIRKLTGIWEIPDIREAHHVQFIIR